MFLNNKEFIIYDSDDEISIKERIAYSLESTLFWTYIKPNDNKILVYSQDVTAINILDELKNKIDNFFSFRDLESYFSFWIHDREDSEFNAVQELGKLYVLLFFENLDVNDMENKILVESFLADSGGSEFDWDFIENIINKKEFLLNDIRKDILELKKKVIKKKNFLTQQNHKQINIKKTNFFITSIVETLNIKTDKPIVLTHVLDNIPLDNLLFARYEKFFKVNENEKKIFQKYDYDYEYNDNTLFIVFFSIEGKKYSFREIKITELSPKEFIVDIDTIQDEINIQELEQILLNSKIDILNRSNTKIKGEFLILDENFHKELFLDEIMNNENFFNMYVNERLKVGKNFSKINIYLYSIKTNSVYFSILNENNNVKIKVSKILSNEYIDYFIDLICSLFKKYKEKELLLLGIYKKYIPSISLNNEKVYDEYENEIIIKKKNNAIQRNPLAFIEPTLFVPLYTRKCAKPPRPIEDDENIPENYDIIEFPKFNEGGLKPRKYICDNTGNFKFPGVRKNTLPNNNIFKYIPCCYETNQELRKKSPLNMYLNGKIQEKNEKYEHVLYRTSRVLPNENKGTLPTGISKIFGNIPRRGVFLGPNSFIDCVSRSCNLYAKDILNETSRKKTLEMLRNNMIAEYSAQENTDMNNYISWFKNPNLYFEPRRFLKSVEAFFKVNIYIFERSANYVSKYNEDNNTLEYRKTQNVDGVMAIPNIPNKGVYLDSKRYKRSAYIFIHMGGAVDTLTYPHCEYIRSDEIQIQENVEKIYRHILIHSHKNRYFKGDENQIKFQYSDSTGRIIRMLTISGEQLKFENPIEPIGVKIKKLEILPEEDLLENYLKMKRLSRVFLEYCMIKYAHKSNEENIDSFIEKYSIIIQDFKYKPIYAKYELEYYNSIFLRDGKLVFESQDTKNRIIYNMKLLEKRSGLFRYIDKPYIYTYFENNLDFEDFIINEQSFKIFAYNNDQGLTMNNFLHELQNTKLILNKDNLNIDLNGYFGVFNSLHELKQKINLKQILQTSLVDTYYIFNKDGYSKFNVENGIGRIIIVYKINSNLFFLGKYSSL